jgi:hypothetical protein
MFCAYLIYRRWYFPEFAAASRSLSLPIGTFNTTVLICSSLTVAMSVRAAQLGNRKMQVRMLLLTLVFGLAFLGIKTKEWSDKYREHHIPTFDYNVVGGEGDDQETHLLGIDKIENDPVKLLGSVRPRSSSIRKFSTSVFRPDRHACYPYAHRCGYIRCRHLMAHKGRFTPEYHTPL